MLPTEAVLSYGVVNGNGITAKSDISVLKLTNPETLLKITARHDLALKLDFKKLHWKRPMYGGFVLLDHPLLA